MDTQLDPETPVLDRLDRQILHSLRAYPRAGFRRIGTVVGASEQTVARRYRAMSEAGVVNVIGVTRLAGAQGWIVRLRCQPSSSVALAQALSARDDVSWVNLSSGGTELVCAAGSGRGRQEGSEAVLLERLPQTKQVTDLAAYALLHRFAGADNLDWSSFDDPLTREQRSQLLQGFEPTPGQARGRPEAQDAVLLARLAEDGRASISDLAAECGWSTGKVSSRMIALRRAGVLQLEAELMPDALGVPYRAMLWLAVRPSRLEEVGTALIAQPETAFVAALSGPNNLAATVQCAGPEQLYQLVSGRIGQLDGVERIEAMPGGRRFKQERSRVVGQRLRPSRRVVRARE